MKSCPCSILDVREEQILEPSGVLCIRLICNVCGSILDSKTVEAPSGEDALAPAPQEAPLPSDPFEDSGPAYGARSAG